MYSAQWVEHFDIAKKVRKWRNKSNKMQQLRLFFAMALLKPKYINIRINVE